VHVISIGLRWPVCVQLLCSSPFIGVKYNCMDSNVGRRDRRAFKSTRLDISSLSRLCAANSPVTELKSLTSLDSRRVTGMPYYNSIAAHSHAQCNQIDRFRMLSVCKMAQAKVVVTCYIHREVPRYISLCCTLNKELYVARSSE